MPRPDSTTPATADPSAPVAVLAYPETLDAGAAVREAMRIVETAIDRTGDFEWLDRTLADDMIEGE